MRQPDTHQRGRLYRRRPVGISFLVVTWFLLGANLFGCKTLQTRKNTASKIQYLNVQQRMTLSGLCVNKPKQQRVLIIFASQYCTHCHRMMDALQKHRAKLKAWKIAPVVMWTDLPNCLKARMAGAHYPTWSFGRPSDVEQQNWAVEATPVLYLLVQKRPILRIDGALKMTPMLAAIQRALDSSK